LRPVTSFPQLQHSFCDSDELDLLDGRAGGVFWIVDIDGMADIDDSALVDDCCCAAAGEADSAHVHGECSIASASSLKMMPPHVGQVTS